MNDKKDAQKTRKVCHGFDIIGTDGDGVEFPGFYRKVMIKIFNGDFKGDFKGDTEAEALFHFISFQFIPFLQLTTASLTSKI